MNPQKDVLPTSGWGRYPVVDSVVHRVRWQSDLSTSQTPPATLAQGRLRSYGDAGLASSVFSTLELNRFLAFDAETGLLETEAGVTLDEILQFCVPKGWFLPVTPGTKHPSIGGCVAADVHGKNHHSDGSLVSHVDSLTIVTAEGDVLRCDRSEHSDLFWASFGGMGLTGFVYAVCFRLMRISDSRIEVETHRTADLAETCQLLLLTQTEFRYSVAWLDLLSRRRRGRGLVMLGRHASGGPLDLHPAKARSIPALGGLLVSRPLLRMGNRLHYRRQLRRTQITVMHYDPYFYPLDGLRDWNRVYGRSGFLQYQFVVPFEAGRECMEEFLDRIDGTACSLAVLKTFGEFPTGMLGFPRPGWTLALDFRRTTQTIEMLQHATSVITAGGGRVYLAKDAVVTAEHFMEMYPRVEEFLAIKHRYDPRSRLRSALSDRLGLT
ncbi:MAG: FAD-binding oxidoreductase [Candidatus Latescibacterota bacterium]|nr:FAD-binding oxidoreductase [Candidatus Latescibacterota bacterium]